MFPEIWNGTLREHYLLLFGAAGGVAMTTGFVAAWLGAHFGARRAARIAAADAVRDAELSGTARLALLQQTVEALAIEVERVAEGQRFTARLLTERPAPPLPAVSPALPRREGTPTPH